MNTFVALDVSLEKTAICVMLADGSIATEVTAATDPQAIAAALGRQEAVGPDTLVGLEAGPLSEWIARGLADPGAPVVLMETRPGCGWRCRRWGSRRTATTRAAWRSCSEWAGSARCT